MLSRIPTAAIKGIQAVPVTVETDISKGIPRTEIVGNVEATIRESKQRIRAAILNSGMYYPQGRIVINLSPADVSKRGSLFDLPIAAGLLASSGQIPIQSAQEICMAGELSLDGNIHGVRGILPLLLACRDHGIKYAVIPYENRQEAGLVRDMTVYAVKNLGELVSHLKNQQKLPLVEKIDIKKYIVNQEAELDFGDVRGQEAAKRALMIGAAGGHGILMSGSPSTGKTMLAECLPGIIPPMDDDELMEVARIYSVSGELSEDMSCLRGRPFRRPHHRITPAALLGGGSPPLPGEVTLANQGVLFLDEFCEFSRSTIDLLRQPLETKQILIARAGETYPFPADFWLVAATNPCRCGYYGDPQRTCVCTQREIQAYQNRISGPILERIDIHIHLPSVSYEEIRSGVSRTSEEMRRDVERARAVQKERFRRAGISINSQMNARQCQRYLRMESSAAAFLEQAYDRYHLNPRTLLKVKKVARTIADVDGSETVQTGHLSEAIQYRRTGGNDE